MNDDVKITVPYSKQTLVYFPGDGRSLWMDDDIDPSEYLKGVHRAVLIARLRAFADLLESAVAWDERVSP